jgi:hypothetical protein
MNLTLCHARAGFGQFVTRRAKEQKVFAFDHT